MCAPLITNTESQEVVYSIVLKTFSMLFGVRSMQTQLEASPRVHIQLVCHFLELPLSVVPAQPLASRYLLSWPSAQKSEQFSLLVLLYTYYKCVYVQSQAAGGQRDKKMQQRFHHTLQTYSSYEKDSPSSEFQVPTQIHCHHCDSCSCRHGFPRGTKDVFHSLCSFLLLGPESKSFL